MSEQAGEAQDTVQVSGMFMAGVGGMGGAGQDLISSCSSLSYSGDEVDFQVEDCELGGKDWHELR